MAYRIRNNGHGAQGIHTLDRGLVFIPAGEERTLEPADMSRVHRIDTLEVIELDAKVPEAPKDIAAAFSKMDPDGDGKPGGSKKGAESTATKGAVRRRRKRRKSAKAKK